MHRGEEDATRPTEQTWWTSGTRAASDRQYESSQQISCKAFSSLLQYSRTERDERRWSCSRELRLFLGDRPSNHHGDIVTPPTIERVLKKLLANLTRGLHRAQPFR